MYMYASQAKEITIGWFMQLFQAIVINILL